MNNAGISLSWAGDIVDIWNAITRRQGEVEDVTRKYPLFVDMRNLLEKLAKVLQPGGTVKSLYHGSFSQLIGTLIEDAVLNPNKPISTTLESLMNRMQLW